MKVLIGSHELDSEKITAVLNGAKIEISEDDRKSINDSYIYLKNQVDIGENIYGINTGYGANVKDTLTPEQMKNSQHNLSAYLDCACGEILSYEQSRLSFLFRTHVLAKGHSGVGIELIDNMISLFNEGFAPCIPSNGALGASGDLVTMAPFARMLLGHKTDFWYKGKLLKDQVIEKKYISGPGLRNSLALMNGLSATCAISYDQLQKFENIFSNSLISISFAKTSLTNENFSTDSSVNAKSVRKFTGQKKISEILTDLTKNIDDKTNYNSSTIQDQYSLRCIPQILGPVYDRMLHARESILLEINSVSDNPIIHTDKGVYHGGNFFGGYLSQAIDDLAICTLKCAELLERQTFILIDGTRELPFNLVKNRDHNNFYHGVKGVHQAISSLLMELNHLSIPASIFSRSSESHNQDIVSNAMNSANRFKKMISLFSKVSSMHAIISTQAAQLRGVELSSISKKWFNSIREDCAFVEVDRPLRKDIERLACRFERERYSEFF